MLNLLTRFRWCPPDVSTVKVSFLLCNEESVEWYFERCEYHVSNAFSFSGCAFIDYLCLSYYFAAFVEWWFFEEFYSLLYIETLNHPIARAPLTPSLPHSHPTPSPPPPLPFCSFCFVLGIVMDSWTTFIFGVITIRYGVIFSFVFNVLQPVAVFLVFGPHPALYLASFSSFRTLP